VIEFVKKEGLPSYESLENRDITSVELGASQYSFVISKPISMHVDASISFALEPKMSF